MKIQLANNRLLVLGFIIICTLVTSGWIGFNTNKSQQQKITALVNITEASLDTKVIASLTGSVDDAELPGYEETRQKMVEIGNAARSVRYIYVLGKRPDGLAFIIDAQPSRFGPPHTSDMADPGTIYREAPPAFAAAYHGNETKIIGPYSDSWGIFYTAVKPIRDDETQKVLGLLAIDVTLEEWTLSLLSAMTPPLVIGLLIVLLYVSTNRLRQKKLLEQNQLYLHRSLINKLSLPIFWLDKDGFIAYANKAAQRFFGKNTDEEDLMIWELSDDIKEDGWMDFWHKSQGKPIHSRLVLKSGDSHHFKYQYASYNKTAYIIANGCPDQLNSNHD